MIAFAPCRATIAAPFVALVLLAASAAGAQETDVLDPPDAPDAPTARWVPWAEVMADHEFDADIDSGGSFEATRFRVGAGAAWMAGPRNFAGVALVYGRHYYAFDGTAGFGALDPWDDITDASIAVPVRWAVTESWDALAVGAVTSRGETDASFDDTLTGSLILGAIWHASDSLSIGPSLGIASQLEDDTEVFPFVMIDWRISEELTLSTRGGGRAIDGPQAVLAWQALPDWNFALGAGQQSRRFRLDDSGPVPDGVGEETAWPVFVEATWGSPRSLEVYAFGGWKLGGELDLEDRNGVAVASSDYDDTPFLGGGLRLAW